MIPKSVLSSLKHLFSIQLLTIAIPFIYYPFLIKAFGVEYYGDIIYIQTIIAYFSLFIQFGFNVTGTKLIAESMEDNNVRDRVFCEVIFIKCCLLLLATILFLSIILTVDFDNKTLYIIFFFSCLADFLNISWFYQAYEKLKVVALSSLISKLVFLILIFTLVKEREDAYIYIILLVVTNVMLQVFLFIKAVFDYNLVYRKVSYVNIVTLLKESSSIFISRFFVIIADKIAITMLGLSSDGKSIAIYDLASKMMNLLQLPFTIANQATYPYFVKNKDMKLFKKYIKLLSSICIIAMIISNLVSEVFIDFYLGDNEMLASSNVFLVLSFGVLFNIFSHNFGNSVLINFNRLKEFNYPVVIGSFGYVFLVFCFYFFDSLTSGLLAFSYIGFTFFVGFCRTYFSFKLKLLTFS